MTRGASNTVNNHFMENKKCLFGVDVHWAINGPSTLHGFPLLSIRSMDTEYNLVSFQGPVYRPATAQNSPFLPLLFALPRG